MNTKEYKKLNEIGRETVEVLTEGMIGTLEVWQEGYGPVVALHLARCVAVGVFYTLAVDSEDFEETLRGYLEGFERSARGFNDPGCNQATERNERFLKSRRVKMA